MEYKDYYHTLAVSHDASQGEIKQAYRRLAMQYHPDRNGNSPEATDKFREINEAFEVLSDPLKRRHYDQISEAYVKWKSKGGSASAFRWQAYHQDPPPSTEPKTSNSTAASNRSSAGWSEFSDFFRRIFADYAPPASTPQKGRADRKAEAAVFQYPVTLTLSEVLHGTSRKIDIDGSKLEVKIPPGTTEGGRVIYKQAVQSPKGKKHDLVVVISLQEDPFFNRRGNDVHCQIEIDVFTAILGGETHVRTLDGEVILQIPAGTQPGRIFRLAGLGLPASRRNPSRGDQYVRVQVKLPQQLSPAERQLFEQLAQLSTQSKGG